MRKNNEFFRDSVRGWRERERRRGGRERGREIGRKE